MGWREIMGMEEEGGVVKLDKQKRNKLFLYLALIMVALYLFSQSFNNDSAEGETKKVEQGFTSNLVEYDNITFEVVGSTRKFDEYTLHIEAKNIGNNPVNMKSIFAITNGDKRFSNNNVYYSESEVNPGMSGTVDLTFKMNDVDINSGEPILVVDRGLILKDLREMKLTK